MAPIDDVREWHYSGNRLHPTQKPITVLKPLIEAFCPALETVLDPFLRVRLDPGCCATY